MSYGAYLTTSGGGIFITPESIPMALVEKAVMPIGSGQITLSYDNSRPVMPMICQNTAAPSSRRYTALTMELNNGQCTLKTYRLAVEGGPIEIYLFSIKQQTPPNYGMAVWDASGQCVLTNDTKILKDVEAIGNPQDPNASGININEWRRGKWAVMPKMCGHMVGIAMTGNGPMPWQTVFSCSSYFDGGSSHIMGVPGDSPPGALQSGQVANYRNRFLIANVDDY